MIAGVVVSLAGLLVLTGFVVTGWAPLMGLDHTLVLDAHREVLASDALLRSAKIATAIGSPVVLNIIVAVAALALLLTRRFRAALYVVVVRTTELGLATLGKNGIARPRPTFPDPVSHASSSSFPSGHAAGSAAVFGALLLIALTWTRAGRWTAAIGGIAAVIVVAAVSSSRVLLGVHYPSDVVAGALLGVECVLAARPIASSLDPRPVSPRRTPD